MPATEHQILLILGLGETLIHAPFACLDTAPKKELAANIKRIEKRITDLAAGEAEPDREAVKGDGWEIWEDKAENRLFISHDSKPPAEVRTHLKRHGFRWNRYAGAWSRMLNNSAWANADYLATNGLLDT